MANYNDLGCGEYVLAVPNGDKVNFYAGGLNVTEKMGRQDEMRFFPVVFNDTVVPNRFEDTNGNPLTFADLASKYLDPNYFLYCEYQAVTYIPSLPPVEDPIHEEKALEFSALWWYEGEVRASRLIINENEQTKNETKILATK